jgi:hypothetical protein
VGLGRQQQVPVAALGWGFGFFLGGKKSKLDGGIRVWNRWRGSAGCLGADPGALSSELGVEGVGRDVGLREWARPPERRGGVVHVVHRGMTSPLRWGWRGDALQGPWPPSWSAQYQNATQGQAGHPRILRG